MNATPAKRGRIEVRVAFPALPLRCWRWGAGFDGVACFAASLLASGLEAYEKRHRIRP